MRKAQQHYIKTFGRIAARNSMPAIAGEIAATLYLSPAPLSFSQLQKRLGVSRASISTNTRLLEYIGTIIKIKMPGIREYYFASSPNANINTIERELERIRTSLQEISEASSMLEPFLVEMPEAVHEKVKGIEDLFKGMCFFLERHRDYILKGELDRGE